MSVIESITVANLAIGALLFSYLLTKIRQSQNVSPLILALIPPLTFQLGLAIFQKSRDPEGAASVILLGIFLVPICLSPTAHKLGRSQSQSFSWPWIIYYSIQIGLLIFLAVELSGGRVIEWVTGILDQPVIIVAQTKKWLFLNVLVASMVALVGLDRTLRSANRTHIDSLKYPFVALLGLAVYFAYLSISIAFTSYIELTALHAGSALILLCFLLFAYAFVRYPLWDIKIFVSRQFVVGSLSLTAVLIYLFISGTLVEFLRGLKLEHYNLIFPAVVFLIASTLLITYLSPDFRKWLQGLITRNFFRNKYDYRDLWMRFSEKASGSLNTQDLLPNVAEFLADAMFVKQVAIWLKSPTAETYHLAHAHSPIEPDPQKLLPLKFRRALHQRDFENVIQLGGTSGQVDETGPFEETAGLAQLGIKRAVLAEKNGEVLAIIGIGSEMAANEESYEDNQLLTSLSNQLAHLILTHKLSDELLLAREWESFNRFASFIIHDLKNLATLQGMTLENAKHLSHNPEFLADAFETFNQTTDKMISLIASLSVQRGQFSLNRQVVNLADVIAATFDDLKVSQRSGVEVTTILPAAGKPPIMSGDRDLLQKAITNLVLNAIQSLPAGRGSVEVEVSPPIDGKIITTIKDTGCGISKEKLANLFRPFQTTKEQGMGIGLVHTRSIIEVHGGTIRIESSVNAGTKVELEFPTL